MTFPPEIVKYGENIARYGMQVKRDKSNCGIKAVAKCEMTLKRAVFPVEQGANFGIVQVKEVDVITRSAATK